MDEDISNITQSELKKLHRIPPTYDVYIGGVVRVRRE